MNILLLGKDGQVGFELRRALASLGEISAIGRADCDLADSDAIVGLLRDSKPDIVVNAAAYTEVDRAETDVAAAFAINARAVGVLGAAAAASGALVVHYSTDYVFNGSKHGPYEEADTTSPQNVYGLSKLAGEQALQASGAAHLIFRTSWVVGAHGANFARTMLRPAAERDSLSVVADQWGAPTSAALIADVTAQVLGQYMGRGHGAFPLGLYHLAAAGVTSWHEYAKVVVCAGHSCGKPLKLLVENIRPITTAEYPTPAVRPANSQLDTRKLRQAFGLTMPFWRDDVERVLERILCSRGARA